MPKQEELNRKGKAYIAGLKFAVGAAWKKACEHDGIDPKTSFAVFSERNPFNRFYQAAMSEYLSACREYAAGGYVGLRIVHGRAV
jgi:hypothetical protein